LSSKPKPMNGKQLMRNAALHINIISRVTTQLSTVSIISASGKVNQK